jgi:anti-sigma factor RsiW
MKLNCRRFATHLHAYVDRATPSALHAAMSAHAASCPACSRKVESVIQIGAVLRAAAPLLPVPEGFARRVMARAVARKTPVPLRLAAWRPSFAWWQEMDRPARAAAAAVLVFGLALGAMMGWDVTLNGCHALLPSDRPDALAAYSLDYLGDAPAGSLAQVVLTMDR